MCLFISIQSIFIPDRSLSHLIIAYKSPEKPGPAARDSAESQELERQETKAWAGGISNIVSAMSAMSLRTLFLSTNNYSSFSTELHNLSSPRPPLSACSTENWKRNISLKSVQCPVSRSSSPAVHVIASMDSWIVYLCEWGALSNFCRQGVPMCVCGWQRGNSQYIKYLNAIQRYKNISNECWSQHFLPAIYRSEKCQLWTIKQNKALITRKWFFISSWKIAGMLPNKLKNLFNLDFQLNNCCIVMEAIYQNLKDPPPYIYWWETLNNADRMAKLWPDLQHFIICLSRLSNWSAKPSHWTGGVLDTW